MTASMEMKQHKSYVQELTKLLVTNPRRDITKAARLYAKLLEQSPAVLERVREQVPFRYWGRLEAVAYGALDVRLFYAYSIGAHRLRTMPLKVQAQALDDGVRVLLPNGEHLNVQVENLTAEQAGQVFDSKNMCVRNDAAQRAYLESAYAKRKKSTRKRRPDYEIHNGKVRINRFMTVQEVMAILAKV